MGAGGVFVCHVPMQGPGQSELGDSGWANLCSPAWAPSLVPAPRTQESALEAGPPRREVRMLREGEPSFNASVLLAHSVLVRLDSRHVELHTAYPRRGVHGSGMLGAEELQVSAFQVHSADADAHHIPLPCTFRFCRSHWQCQSSRRWKAMSKGRWRDDWPLHFGGFCCPPLPESSSAQVDAAGLAHTIFSRAFTRHCPFSSLSGHVGCALICVFRFRISLASLWELSFLSQIPTAPKSSSWIQN